MTAIWPVLVFILALSIIVAVHEFGHYIVARWSGIRAEVFSIGFGPRLLSRVDRHGTRWQVAALPLGGYVRFLGDADAASAGASSDVGTSVPAHLRRQTLEGAPLWARAATLLAGPGFNFIFSFLIFAGLLLWSGVAATPPKVAELFPLPPQVAPAFRAGDEIAQVGGRPVQSWAEVAKAWRDSPDADWTVRRDGRELSLSNPVLSIARVDGIAPRSAAAAAGVQVGDVITSINGVPVTSFEQVRDLVAGSDGDNVTFGLWRVATGETEQVSLRPQRRDLPKPDGGFETRWLVGITGGGLPFMPARRPATWAEAAAAGYSQTVGIITSSLIGMKALIFGEISSCNVGGAISIAQSTTQAANQGGESFIRWLAVLSAAIGFMNLLPIPVLDGGHLMFYAYEAVTRRKPSDRVRNGLTVVGMSLVLSLMLFGLSNDLFCR